MTEMTKSCIEDSGHAPAPESVSPSVSRYQASSGRSSRQRAESQSLHRWSAKYCPLVPAPRSTIAAAFSSDGRAVASTHGDHTVKIIDCQTGKCLKELVGHQRIPWVVRYHPLYSDIVASGSLDHEVRLWDAKTSQCIGTHYFYRPIASISFHAKGDMLAVASGHKLFIWDYSKPDEALNPARILRTRRSLRAVHFHPHGGPYILTAEVNDIDSGDSTLTPATSSGYSNCRSAVILANINSMCCHHLESRLSSPFLLWPAYLRDDRIICPLCNDRDIGSTNVQERLSSLAQNLLLTDAENLEISQLISPMDACPGESGVANDDDSVSTSLYAGTEIDTVRMESNSRVYSVRAANNERFSERDGTQTSYLSSNIPNPEMVPHSIPDGPSGIRMDPFTVSSRLPFVHNLEHVTASSSVPATTGSSSGSIPHYTSHTHQMGSIAGAGSLFLGSQISEAAVRGASLHVGQEVPTSLFEGSLVQ